MNPWRNILLSARPSLIVLACAIALALALAFGSAYLENDLRTELQQGRSQINSLQANLSGGQDDLSYLQAHIAEFRNLKQQGLLSTPDRENWVEHLLAAQQQLHLPATLAYSLPPPVPMSSGGAGEGEPAADAPLMHDIEISLRDIHEGELLALLSDFQASIHDRFRVQSCQLSIPTPTGLAAQCTLRFFTLRPAASTANAGAS